MSNPDNLDYRTKKIRKTIVVNFRKKTKGTVSLNMYQMGFVNLSVGKLYLMVFLL